MNLTVKSNGFLSPRRVDLFSEISKELDHAMNNIFGHDFFSGLSKKGRGYPLMDAIRNKDSWVLQYSVPGVEKDDLNVEITEDDHGKLLSVSGFLHEDYTTNSDNYAIRELSSQEFRRVIRLPNDIGEDDPKISLKDGILKITFNAINQNTTIKDKIKRLKVE